MFVFKCLLNTNTLSNIYYPDQPMHKLYINNDFLYLKYFYSRSQWPRGLRRGSAAARLLGLRVRIPPEEWMSVCCDCCGLSGRGLCDGLITRPEESYRLWCVWVWSWILDNYEALGYWELLRHGKDVLLHIFDALASSSNTKCAVHT